MVALNHAVAVAMADGPAAGLERVQMLAKEKQLAEDHRLHAVRAHLLEMTGDTAAAREAYLAAARRATNLPQQRYLNRQAARLDDADNELSESQHHIWC
jgi:predicted RNA polymerase sigma factor